MTIGEMHTAVKLELDKSDALDTPAFEDEELDFWLNTAIRNFVKTRYSGTNVKRGSFEQTQKRLDDLRTLVKHATIALFSDPTDYPNAYIPTSGGVVVLPWEEGGDYLLTVSEEVNSDSLGKRLGVTQCTYDTYRQLIDNPFSEHILHYGSAKPLRLFDEDQVKLITDGNYTLDTYYLTYIRKPVTVNYVSAGHVTNVDCDLPEHTHDEIVKIATSMMLENIEQPRLKTHSEFVATME